MFRPPRKFASFGLWLLVFTSWGPALAAESADHPTSVAEMSRQIAKLTGARVDPALGQAADRHARQLLEDRRHATRSAVEKAVRREGLADALLLPFSMVGGDPTTQHRALRRFARRTAQSRAPTHVGIARRHVGDRTALVAVFSRRLVELAPLAPKRRNAPFTIRGRAPPNTDIEVLMVGPCRGEQCRGGVENARVKRSKTLFEATLRPRGAGWYVAEIMVDGARGPEAAALWRFRVGAKPGPPPPKQPPFRSIRESIRRQRDLADLGPLTPHPALEKAARKHAKNVCRAGVAAHVLKDGDPSVRAAAAGYPGVVAENVAIADTAAAAHHDFMWSPSHKRNVLDPLISDVGIGVVKRPASTGLAAAVCVVEMFGQGR